MKKVIIESPYAGDIERNTIYARRAMKDSLDRGEAPFLSHLLYTQVYDDTVPELRVRGLRAGKEWILVADLAIFYLDYGMSPGMQKTWDDLDSTISSNLCMIRYIGKNP